MDLRVLHYFLTVAREQSFTKASKQLYITQPTLSRQLAALEEELGAKLLDRGGHKITLTEEGLLLKRRALDIIDLENKIIEEFKGNEEVIEGTITIVVVNSTQSIISQRSARYFRKNIQESRSHSTRQLQMLCRK